VKLKLDENIGRRGRELLKATGHDVMTVWDQGLRGVTDEKLSRFAPTRGERLLPSIVISARSRDSRPRRAPE
jgi:hypothetical protein